MCARRSRLRFREESPVGLGDKIELERIQGSPTEDATSQRLHCSCVLRYLNVVRGLVGVLSVF